MKRSILALAALPAVAACDRSDPPVNQVGIDINAITPSDEPADTTGPEPANASTAPQPVTAATTLPAAYHGVFDQNPAACASASSVFRLTVSGGELRFHESLADVQNVTPDGAGAVRVAANYSGEGMTWSTIQRVALSNEGKTLTITGEGEPFSRIRCS